MRDHTTQWHSKSLEEIPADATFARLSQEFALLCDTDGSVRWADERALRLAGVAAGQNLVARAVLGSEDKVVRGLAAAAAGDLIGWEILLTIESREVAVVFSGAPCPGGMLLVGSAVPYQHGRDQEEMSAALSEIGVLHGTAVRQHRSLQEVNSALMRADERRRAMLRSARQLAGGTSGDVVREVLVADVAALFSATDVVLDIQKGDSVERPQAEANSSPLDGGPGALARRLAMRARQTRCGVLSSVTENALGLVGMATPLAHEGRVLGSCGAERPSTHAPFTTEDLEFLEVLTGIACAALAGREYAQLEAVALTARELADLVNNALVPATANVDYLIEYVSLSAETRDLLVEASAALAAAKRHVQQLGRVVRWEIRQTPMGPSLDLGRSTD